MIRDRGRTGETGRGTAAPAVPGGAVPGGAVPNGAVLARAAMRAPSARGALRRPTQAYKSLRNGSEGWRDTAGLASLSGRRPVRRPAPRRPSRRPATGCDAGTLPGPDRRDGHAACPERRP